jgi:hypothetical protein
VDPSAEIHYIGITVERTRECKREREEREGEIRKRKYSYYVFSFQPFQAS